MAPLSSTAVEQIKERLSIVDVIGSYLKLERAGANLKAKCPFHNEKTPSFFVSSTRNSFYCFGCGAKGDIFSFVEQFEGVDFKGALAALAARAGVSLERFDPQERDETDRLYRALEAATAFFEGELKKSAPAREYLVKRGLTAETVAAWRIGFVPPGWRALRAALLAAGFSDAELQRAGLTRPSDKGREPYDWFRSRIMFPIFDSSGRVVGFSGRLFGEEERDGLPKYINSPETPLFNKSSLLYGFHSAKNAIRTRGYSIIVEGQVDVVMSQQSGFVNTVASSGTALTERHLTQLQRLSQNVIMAFDADRAGQSAAVRSATLALSLGMDVKIARLPAGMDPADACKENPKRWTEAIKSAVPLIAFYTDAVIAAEPDARKRERALVASVLPLVAALQSATEQSRAVADISFKTGVREDALWQDVRRLAALPKDVVAASSVNGAGASGVPTTETRPDAVIRRIAAIIAWQESVPNPVNPPAALRERLRAADARALDLLPLYDADREALLFEAELFYGEKGVGERELAELFRIAESAALKRSFEAARTALAAAERSGDTEAAAKWFATCQDLAAKLGKESPGKG